MPIEVKELVIRANVRSEKADESKKGGGDDKQSMGQMKHRIIEEVMERVREALENQSRR